MMKKRKSNLKIFSPLLLLFWWGMALGQTTTLMVGDNNGPPGSVNNVIAVSLSNTDTIAGLIFTLNYDPNVLTPSRITTVDRTQDQSGLGFNVDTPGELVITLFDYDGNPILPSNGELLQVLFDIQNTSPEGASLLSVTNGVLSGTSYQEIPHSVTDGTLTVAGTQALAPPLNLVAQIGNGNVVLSWGVPASFGGTRSSNFSPIEQKNPTRIYIEDEGIIPSLNRAYKFSEMNIIDEIEPNNTVIQAQPLTGIDFVMVNGKAEISDLGDILYFSDDIEDLFLVTITQAGLYIYLYDFISDCDLLLYEGSEFPTVKDFSTTISATNPEEIESTDLPPGTYIIGVSIYDPDPIGPDSTAYLLYVEGQFSSGQPAHPNGYRIYRSQSPNAVSSGSLLVQVDSSITTYQDQPSNSQTYYYQVTALYNAGESLPSNEVSVLVTEVKESTLKNLPESYCLFQNYPNPFNPETFIAFELPQSCFVQIKIYNISGQEIRCLIKEPKPAGRYTVNWDGKDALGRPVPSGIYLYELAAKEFHDVKRLILLK